MIETPGAQDVYTFTAAPGQTVYFRLLKSAPGMEAILWRLEDANGSIVFNNCLTCGEPGVKTLDLGGTYTLTVGSPDDPATGSYQFQLTDVPPPGQYPIAIGDKVARDTPAPGAGMIETPGAQDAYTFTAAPGQTVYFRLLKFAPGMEAILWRLEDENGNVVFNNCLSCPGPGAETLDLGGTYTLTVGSPDDPATGSYSFALESPN